MRDDGSGSTFLDESVDWETGLPSQEELEWAEIGVAVGGHIVLVDHFLNVVYPVVAVLFHEDFQAFLHPAVNPFDVIGLGVPRRGGI